MGARGDEEGHVRQRIAKTNRLNVCVLHASRFVRCKYSILMGRQLEVLTIELIPNGLVNAGRIACRRWKEIEHQDVDALLHRVGNLGDKLVQGPIAVFVPRRDDFNEGHDASEVMADRDAISFFRVIGLVRLPVDSRFRPFEYRRARWRHFVGRGQFNGQDIRFFRSASLFHKG